MSRASVAPIDEAKEAIRVPSITPKIAPLASVSRAAPGSDTAVVKT